MATKKATSWLVIIVGLLLILPLLGVSQLGNITEGFAAWIIAILVLIMGFSELSGK